MGRPAVFLDRDGVINENLDGTYVQSWDSFRFLPGSLEAIASLTRAGYPIVVVTNQQGIGKGIMTEVTLEEIHRRMLVSIQDQGGSVAAVLHCPHLVEAACPCRKPQPGMFRDAAERLGLDLERSVVVGDALSDVQAALSAGCRAILVKTGRGGAALADVAATYGGHAQVAVADDLPAEVRLILAEAGPAVSVAGSN